MSDVVYDVGDEVTLVSTFKNNQGQLADPDTVIFRFKDPEGTLVTQQWTSAVPGTDITRVSLGIFSAKVPIDKAGGSYSWHWLGQGAVKAATESDTTTALKVRTTGFAPVP